MRAAVLFVSVLALARVAPVAADDACLRDCEDILCATRCWSAVAVDEGAIGRAARGRGAVDPELPVCPPLGPVAVRDLTVSFTQRTYLVTGVGACLPASWQ